jgi:Holliday junction resolvase RusA-like endonuclease
MKPITFTINLCPKPKGRPRYGRTSDGRPVVFTDNATRAFEAAVGQMSAYYIKSPLEGPIRLDILMVLPRPQRLLRKKDPPGLIWAPKRPDRDNIEKAICDGLKTCFRDDAQICAGEPVKVYAEKNGKPRIIISIVTLEDDDPLTENPYLARAYAKDIDPAQNPW